MHFLREQMSLRVIPLGWKSWHSSDWLFPPLRRVEDLFDCPFRFSLNVESDEEKRKWCLWQGVTGLTWCNEKGEASVMWEVKFVGYFTDFLEIPDCVAMWQLGWPGCLYLTSIPNWPVQSGGSHPASVSEFIVTWALCLRGWCATSSLAHYT